MDAEGNRPQDLRMRNCRKMLRVLSESESQTVNEIAAKMHLSRTAVGNILLKLTEDGMVVEGQKRSSTKLGGKRAASYGIRPDYKYSVFVYLNGDSAVAELNNFALSRMDFRIADVSCLAYEEMIARLADMIREMLRDAGVSPEQVYGIAIAVSGMVDSEKGIILEFTGSDTHNRWGNSRNVAADLRNAMGCDPDVYVDNMCNFSGYASFLADTGGEADSCVYVLAHSYGIGATYIKNGNIAKGVHGLLGEIGHVTVDYASPYRCRCGRKGCFESLLYPEYIRSRADAAAASGAEGAPAPGSITGVDDLLRAAGNGSGYAQQEIQVIAGHFAKLFYNIQLMADPDRIIFHDAFPVQLEALHEEIRRICAGEQEMFLKVPIELTFDSAMFTERVRSGAAVCLRNRFLDRHMP